LSHGCQCKYQNMKAANEAVSYYKITLQFQRIK
jgi:hypothetical protein